MRAPLLPLRLALPALFLLAGAPAEAQEAVAVRFGTHPTYSRVVFDWQNAADYTLSREGDRLRITFARTPEFQGAAQRRLPPMVSGFSAEGDSVVIALAPGARVRDFRLGGRIVLDVLPAGEPAQAAAPQQGRPQAEPRQAAPAAAQASAPPAPAAAVRFAAQPLPQPLPLPPPPPPELPRAAAAREVPLPPRPANPAERPREETLAAPAPGATPAAAPSVASGEAQPRSLPPLQPVPQRQAPISLAAAPHRGTEGPAARLPFGRDTGVAVLRRGDELWVVFDDPRPIDLSALRNDPAFGRAVLTLGPAAALLRIPAPAPATARVTPADRGLIVELLPAGGPAAETVPAEVLDTPSGRRLLLRAQGPGGAVNVQDPETGEVLLIGTLKAGEVRQPVTRAFAEFSLVPTLRGVAVIAQSDHVTMRSQPEGFVLMGGPQLAGGLSLSPAQLEAPDMLAGHALTRAFDLPALPHDALAERVRLLRGEAAAAPPRARSRPRLALAEAMLALGFGVEARAVLDVAAAEDPVVGATPRWAALAGAASLLAGRLDEAKPALKDSRLDGTDEITLWRAYLADQEGEPADATAPLFAASAGLLPSYPDALRARLGSAAAEAMAAGGEAAAAAALLARLGDLPSLALARALLDEAQGRIDEALAAYEALGTARDRRMRYRALSRGMELALREGRIGAPEAAARIEPLLYAWRGDASERLLRLRAAELRADAGDWPGALALLRETEAAFPEHLAEIRPRTASAFLALFRDGAADQMPPSQAVALFEESADLLPTGTAGDAVVARVAERLIALDLTQRAAAMLTRLMASQPEGGLDRARTGLRLGQILLGDRDAEGALAALAATDAERLPASLAAERLILRARAMAASGNRAAALAMLRGLPGAAEVRVDIAAAQGDWAETTAALAEIAEAQLPPADAALDEPARRLLVRLAAAAALAGDTATLASLAQTRGAQMASGAFSEPFRLLTADPVAGAVDLPRLAAEVQLARALPRSIAAIGGAARN
ncbi:MAG: hypothetical protein MUC64_16000 [Rubritepida sp.]|nr:hypothetical protein [Rubritepida sp.]